MKAFPRAGSWAWLGPGAVSGHVAEQVTQESADPGPGPAASSPSLVILGGHLTSELHSFILSQTCTGIGSVCLQGGWDVGVNLIAPGTHRSCLPAPSSLAAPTWEDCPHPLGHRYWPALLFIAFVPS